MEQGGGEAQRRQQRELACLMQAELERSEDEGAYEAAVFDSFWRKEFEAVAEAIDPSLSPERSAAVLRDRLLAGAGFTVVALDADRWRALDGRNEKDAFLLAALPDHVPRDV